MNKLFEEIEQRINDYDSIVIFTHVTPDGDTIGTSVALREYINLNYSNKDILISGDQYPLNLKWLPGNDKVSEEVIKKSLAILVDTSGIHRCFDKRILKAKEIVKIDHHHPEGDEWSIAIEGDIYPATGEILLMMAKHLNWTHNQVALEAIFTSIWTDTSGMVERHPTDATKDWMRFLEDNGVSKAAMIVNLELPEKLNQQIEKYLKLADSNKFISTLIIDEEVSNDIYRPLVDKFVKGFQSEVYIIGCLSNNGKYRVGLRSDKHDISVVAEHFGGGGHKQSSGCYRNSPDQIHEVENYVKTKVLNVCY